MNKWVICAGEKESACIETYLRTVSSSCEIQTEPNAWRLREMLKHAPLAANVVVGSGVKGPDAINVAASLIQDVSCEEVVLVLEDASGSLRSRAKRAGITRVLTFDELRGVSMARRVTTSEIERIPRFERSAEAERVPKVEHVPKIEQLPEVSRASKSNQTPKNGASAQQDSAASIIERRSGVPVLAFVSGRGGVGKTTICALAGHIASRWGLRVALLDLDLAFGNLYALCGSEHAGDLTNCASANPLSLDVLSGACVSPTKNLEIYGPCRAPEYAEVVQPHVANLVALLSQNHDLVLIDTTNNWNDAVAAAAQMADRVAIVSDDRPGAIPALARCGGLAVRLGVARTRIVRIMNGCDPKLRDEAFVSRAAAGLECAREIRVYDGDIEAIELLACGRPAELIEAENPLATSVAKGLAQILRELGSLPACEAAQNALSDKRRTARLFKRKKQAVLNERT